MGKNPAQLNQKQADVLGWIIDGCPDGVFSDPEHRITARALERRGLVTISGKGSTWAAVITDMGRKWHAEPPAAVLPDEADADRLIARVLEAGDCLVLPQDREVEESHRRLVALSLKSQSRPRGKKLEMVSTGAWGQGPKAIVFTEHFDDLVETRPVSVPERIAKYHPAVKAFVADKDWQFVSSDHVPRAARILQAIATAAADRGIDAMAPVVAAKRRSRDLGRCHLALATPAGVYGLQIKEIAARGAPKIEPRQWNHRKIQPSWIQYRGWEFISTGKLELVVKGPGSSYNGDHYRDAKTVTVEDKLPQVFRAFEIQKLRADWREQEREREKADRRRRWEAAMADAKERYFEHARWEHFKDCSHEWQSVNQYRGFLAAAREAAEQYAGTDRDAILRQLEEAARSVDARDPILQLSRIVPGLAEPKPEDLKPFLQGWSPHGPDGSVW
ncbi:hypothetical protein NBRGN_065_00420 [Nocardia brasiliensis NBRC 14402]|uniref:hypothetical protein n=1 Tax=Nocardia brasiliensis TaxID=37326 RepID=UPI00045C5A8B|nr:hypothetical protein [Nocardia brasiliensis]ASF10906.2 hypothetical protein CEQ30_30200 [Nocardia brasiliensis]GAJ83646.1 hypothetical protein NBRGN_065_00420 [Nocardia brasiliensis NBRC 14402]